MQVRSTCGAGATHVSDVTTAFDALALVYGDAVRLQVCLHREPAVADVDYDANAPRIVGCRLLPLFTRPQVLVTVGDDGHRTVGHGVHWLAEGRETRR